jgi:hypothetical protein
MNVPSGPIRSAPTAPTSSGVPARPAADNWINLRYPSPRGRGTRLEACVAKHLRGRLGVLDSQIGKEHAPAGTDTTRNSLHD